VGGFDFGWRAVVELAVDAVLVEPGHPPTGGEFEVLESFPVPAVGLWRRVCNRGWS